nr:MAG TPA: hypothetical protein [Caudoviricetes sp.]
MNQTRKKMTTATDINTTVKPVAICRSDACDTLITNTGRVIWMGYEIGRQIDPEDGSLDYDEGVYGEDEKEREAATTGLSWVSKKPEAGTSWLFAQTSRFPS